MKQCCETCSYWALPDPSRKRIGNVGVCTWMLPKGTDFYDKSTHAPYWASEIVHRTASFCGRYCGVYEAKTAKRKKK